MKVFSESQIGTILARIKEEIDMVAMTVSSAAGVEIVPWTGRDAYIATNGATADPETTVSSTTGYRYCVVECAENDVFVVMNGSGGAAPRLWAFIDSSNNVLTVSDASLAADKVIVTAPADAAKLIVNSNRTSVVYKSTQTVTGNPAVLSIAANKPLTGLTIPFTPIQSGSGDPSPENVRPISGIT